MAAARLSIWNFAPEMLAGQRFSGMVRVFVGEQTGCAALHDFHYGKELGLFRLSLSQLQSPQISM
jgi:hypothetical protein